MFFNYNVFLIKWEKKHVLINLIFEPTVLLLNYYNILIILVLVLLYGYLPLYYYF